MKGTAIFRGCKRLLMVLLVAILIVTVFVFCAAAEDEARFTAVSLTAGESVTMNFYASAPADADVLVKFTYKDAKYYPIHPVSYENGLYRFSFYDVAPHSFDYDVTATLYVNGEVCDTRSYSVAEYCAAALSQPTTANVAQALLDYGAIAKWYVGASEKNPGVVGLPIRNQMPVLHDKRLDAADGTETATLDRVGLILSNTISTYFDFTSQTAEPSFKVSVDGTVREARVIPLQGNTYRAIIPMKGTEIFSKIVATVTDAEGNDISRTATYSVAAYLYKSLDSDDEKLTTLVRAIYAYGLCAHELGSHTVEFVSLNEGKQGAMLCSICQKPAFIGLEDAVNGAAYNPTYKTDGTGQYEAWWRLDTGATGNAATDSYVLTETNGSHGFITMTVVADGLDGNIYDTSDPTKIKTNQNEFAFKLVANSSAYGSDFKDAQGNLIGRWSAKHATVSPVFYINDGVMYAVDNTNLGAYPAGGIDLAIGFSYDANGNLVLAYYIDGVYKTTANAGNTLGHSDAIKDGSGKQTGVSELKFRGFTSLYISAYNLTDNKAEVSDLRVVYTNAVGVTENDRFPCGTVYYTQDGVRHEIPAHAFEGSADPSAMEMRSACKYCGKTYAIPYTKICEEEEKEFTSPTSSGGKGEKSYGVPTATEAVFGFELKNGETRNASFAVQWKVNGTKADGSATNSWDYSLGIKLTIDTSGNIKFGDDTIGTLTTDGYTSFLVKITMTQDAETAADITKVDYTIELWMDNVYVGKKTQTRNSAGVKLAFNANNSYFQLSHSLPADNKTTTVYARNIFFAAPTDEPIEIHDWKEAANTTTCFADGILYEQCTVCAAIRETPVKQYIHDIRLSEFDAAGHAVYKCSICRERFAFDAKNYATYKTTSTADKGGWNVVGGDGTVIANGELLLTSLEIGNAQISPDGKNLSSATQGVWGFSLKNSDVRGADFLTQLKVYHTTLNAKDGAGNSISDYWVFNKPGSQLRIKPNGDIYFAGADTGMDLSADAYTDFVMKVTLTENGSSTTVAVELWINGVHAGSSSYDVDVTGASLQNGNSYVQMVVSPAKNAKEENDANTNAMYYDNVFVADVPNTLAEQKQLFEGMSLLHNYTSRVTLKPTCLATGERLYTCISGCGDSYTEVIPKKTVCDMDVVLKGGAISAECPHCGKSWTADASHYYNNYKIKGNVQNLGTRDGTHWWYRLSAGVRTQMYLNYNTSCADIATRKGVFSISVKGIPAGGADWVFQFTNTSSGAVWMNEAGFNGQNAKGLPFLVIYRDGTVRVADNVTNDQGLVDIRFYDILGTLKADAFTNIAVTFERGEGDTLKVEYYINGEHVCTRSIRNILVNNTPSGVYADFTKNNAADLLINSAAFGCTDAPRDAIRVHEHKYVHCGSDELSFSCACGKSFTLTNPIKAAYFSDGKVSSYPLVSLPVIERYKNSVKADASQGYLAITGPINNTTMTNNVDIRVGGANGAPNSKTMVVGMSLSMPEGGLPENGAALNCKVAGAWPNPGLTIDAGGSIYLGSTLIGHLREGEFTQLWIKAVMDASNKRVTFTFYIDGEERASVSKSVSVDLTNETWSSNGNTYMVLQIAKNDKNKLSNRGLYLDNLFVSDALPTFN